MKEQSVSIRRLKALNDAGSILWSGRRLGRKTAAVSSQKKRPTVAEIVVENRR